jgi:hypothetical protein
LTGTVEQSRAAGRYLRFLGLATLLTLAVALVGVAAAQVWAGARVGMVPALIAGCCISWLASALGGVPVLLAELAGDRGDQSGGPARRAAAGLSSLAVRFAAELVFLVALVWSGRFDRVPLLLWAAVSYLVLLAADTKYALGPRGPAPNR